MNHFLSKHVAVERQVRGSVLFCSSKKSNILDASFYAETLTNVFSGSEVVKRSNSTH